MSPDPPPTPLERDLAAVRPRRPSRDLAARIAADLAPSTVARRLPFADRCLLAAMSAGSLAAAVIIVLLITQSASPPGPPIAAASPVIPSLPRFGDSLPAFARADAPSPLFSVR